ncbi:MAG: succinylglutamate desuccinylase/aspartoacylase family protein [Acetobacter aceti]|uniref:succinylglutamate desuccinylase/aspartoacylase domain-containing protein n=1 Tax=Acetobacter aceti TaxID=435 RepID=UPI001EED3E1C|nr:succinylglutamate desuccinylase/aspartoacylase family protein [Acetobacter aceti]
MDTPTPSGEDYSVRTTPTRRLSDQLPPSLPNLPSLPLELTQPDLSPWREGNVGIPGVHRLSGPLPGPHVAVTALMHGNEYAGAIVLADLLRQGFVPRRGTLSLIFLNLSAFARFSPQNPIMSRFVDEDMNRLWDTDSATSVPRSSERARVRQLLPYISTVDRLLDLHSMLWPADPLILAGPSEKGVSLAESIGTPSLIVVDDGHRAGPRLIDLQHFSHPESAAQACLLEAGQHWTWASLRTTQQSVRRFLSISETEKEIQKSDALLKVADVTHRITAHTGHFTFTELFPSGALIPHRGTLIARDGHDEIRTPYDNCLLVMPNFRAARHHTAVRLARIRPAKAV